MTKGNFSAIDNLITNILASLPDVAIMADDQTRSGLGLDRSTRFVELRPDSYGLWRSSLGDNQLDAAMVIYVPKLSPSLELLMQEVYRICKSEALCRVLVEVDDPAVCGSVEQKLALMGEVRESDGNTFCMKLWRKPRIIAMMRIKDEGRWIDTVLHKADQFVDGFVILDDGSTDATPDICGAHPKTIELIRQRGIDLDEVRDKNMLLRKTLDHNPDWIFCLDGDEVLEDCGQMALRREIRICPDNVIALGLTFPFMWDNETQYRDDRNFNDQHHKRLLRTRGRFVNANEMSFKPSGFGGNFHCGSIPRSLTGRRRHLDVNLKHYGYYELEQRERKRAWYEKHDPENAAKGYYDYLDDNKGMLLRPWRERGIEEVLFSDVPLVDYPSMLYADKQEFWKLGYFLPAGVSSYVCLGEQDPLGVLGLRGQSIKAAPRDFADALAALANSSFDVLLADIDEKFEPDDLDKLVWQAQRVVDRLIVIRTADEDLTEDLRRNRFYSISARMCCPARAKKG